MKKLTTLADDDVLRFLLADGGFFADEGSDFGLSGRIRTDPPNASTASLVRNGFSYVVQDFEAHGGLVSIEHVAHIAPECQLRELPACVVRARGLCLVLFGELVDEQPQPLVLIVVVLHDSSAAGR
ncbi:hypothetical protein PF010_g16466 [Phytophthora fragariae]|uniref:Uncharacterized protein n=1 Tax=Phytophthora fragariae TaxID=53985 RepID=A0A6G0KRT5_9STRA|nr:hypothetical protein PF010_g16466 [Phytophthora fragariae]